MIEPNFILASISPRRKKVLEILGIPFQIIPSKFHEEYDNTKTPEETVQLFAFKKAMTVAEDYPQKIIIGADTIVVMGDEIFGKPNSDKDAQKMLIKLSGKTHTVFTGISIIKKDAQASLDFVEKTKVTFFSLSTGIINFYINNHQTLDKAGAYGIQDWSACFIKSIHGCYYNVTGFPLARFFQEINTDSFRKAFNTYNWLGKDEHSP